MKGATSYITELRSTRRADKKPWGGASLLPTMGRSMLPSLHLFAQILDDLALALFVVARLANAAAATAVIGPHGLGKVSQCH